MAPCAALLVACGGSQASTASPPPVTPPPALTPDQPTAPGVRVIITLANPAPAAFRRKVPARAVLHALELRAQAAEASIRAFLEAHGAKDIVSLPTANGLAATLPAEVVALVREQPGVVSVVLDRVITAPRGAAGDPAPPAWNLAAIRAPSLWARGLRGHGVTVAVMDTGVDGAHPLLAARFRAKGWFDPVAQSATPVDPLGHGTQVLGLITSSDALSVAPEAQWIAARIFDATGKSSVSVIHQAFAWLLDPDGDPATDDAPQVVNASWGIGEANACDQTFAQDLAILRDAGIAVVFAAGNAGPHAASSVSPANNPGAFAAGAVDAAVSLSLESSRGPSACGGGLFPDVVAPGVNVATTDLSFGGVGGTTSVSGTSFAAPHVAGTLALLVEAFPHATPDQLFDALRRSALATGEEGAGHGLLDANGAWALLAANASERNAP